MVAGLGGAPMDGGGARGAYAFVISEGSMVCVVVIDLTASKSFFGRDRLVRQPPRPLRSEDTLSERTKKDATLASSLSRRCSPRGTAATFRSSMTRDREQLLDDAILLGRHRITWFFGGSVVFVEHHQKK